MAHFEFIREDDFKGALEDDFDELNRCLEAKAWKASTVLAGSIVETVLVYALIKTGKSQKPEHQILKMTLGEIIKTCAESGIVSSKTLHLSEVIKEFRNLIHPGRARRLGESVDENAAGIARSLVEIILNEVSSTLADSSGFTSEQVLLKLERDPSAVAILDHILKTVDDHELNRLLVHTLPEQYLQYHAMQGAQTGDAAIGVQMESFVRCFKLGYARANNDIRKDVATKLVSVIKEEASDTVSEYVRAFFNLDQLSHLDQNDVDLVCDHLISRLAVEMDVQIYERLSGIGSYLRTEAAYQLSGLLAKRCMDAPTNIFGNITVQFAVREFTLMESDAYELAKSLLEALLTALEPYSAQTNGHRVERLQYLIASIENAREAKVI